MYIIQKPVKAYRILLQVLGVCVVFLSLFLLALTSSVVTLRLIVIVCIMFQSAVKLTTSAKPISMSVYVLISGVLRHAARKMRALIRVASITVTRLGPPVMSSGVVMRLGFTVFPPRLCDTLGLGNWSQRGQ